MELPWSDGSVQMVSLTPLNGLNGHRPGWVIILRDITAIKRLDQLKSQMLREAVGKIHLPMAQAMNALTELNSLAVQDERLVDVVYRLSSSWKQIQDWGDDLLDVARLNTDLNVNPNAVNLAVVLSETQRSLSEGLLRQGKLKIKIACEPNLPLVLADIAHLRRLLQMLINRAAGRSKEGGEIRLIACQHYRQVWIEISDDGPQISDADLNHIFDRSYGGAKGSALNSDIEVILVKTILERMGGQIWAGGQGSIGSTITICLPTFENPVLGKA
jgi:signal transduction histidine kinase